MSELDNAVLNFKNALKHSVKKVGSLSTVYDNVEKEKQNTNDKVSDYWKSRGRLVLSNGHTIRY